MPKIVFDVRLNRLQLLLLWHRDSQPHEPLPGERSFTLGKLQLLIE